LEEGTGFVDFFPPFAIFISQSLLENKKEKDDGKFTERKLVAFSRDDCLQKVVL
jgi:hypothetical protein